jgi:hypothetical protein
MRMDIKIELSEMKSGLSAFMAEVRQRFESAEPKMKFAELTLVDGTIVSFEGEEAVVGTALNVVGLEGVVPAPDGTHETTEGLLITTVNGIITNIETKKMETPEVEVEIETNEFASKEEFAALNDRIAKLEEMLVSLGSKVEDTFSVFEKFASQTPEPVAKPFGPVKIEKNEALKGFASALNNNKK